MKDKLTIISDDLNHNIITELEARKQLLILLGIGDVIEQKEQLKHDNLTIGSKVEIDLTFTEKHIGRVVSIGEEKVKVENNDWTYEVSKQNISKVF